MYLNLSILAGYIALVIETLAGYNLTIQELKAILFYLYKTEQSTDWVNVCVALHHCFIIAFCFNNIALLLTTQSLLPSADALAIFRFSNFIPFLTQSLLPPFPPPSLPSSLPASPTLSLPY